MVCNLLMQNVSINQVRIYPVQINYYIPRSIVVDYLSKLILDAPMLKLDANQSIILFGHTI